MKIALTAVLAVTPYLVHAGGSNYGIAPGSLTNFTGKVSEWPVPTPRFARDPAVAPDGSIFIAVMSGNKIARFDTPTQTFREWEMPAGHRPHGLLVDKQGMVWVNEINLDTVVRFDPKTEHMRVVKLPSTNVGIRKMVVDAQGRLWYMGSHNGRLGVVE